MDENKDKDTDTDESVSEKSGERMKWLPWSGRKR